MRQALLLTLLSTLLLGCTDPAPSTYPVSGEACGPDDPVQTLDAADCTPPVQG